MSMAPPDERPQEIVIIRRGKNDEEEGHHGGVWKIAFADFMTAMMCFFLVMWLISAANEQTKAAVASYFNPIKLIDRNSSRKGLEDIGDGPNALGMETDHPGSPDAKAGTDGPGVAGPSMAHPSAYPDDRTGYSDEHLFSDPYAVLAEIVADTGIRQNISEKGDGGLNDAGPATGASGGESYRDPFAPDFWSQQVAAPDSANATAQGAKSAGKAAKGREQATEILGPEKLNPAAATPPPEAIREAAAPSPPAPPAVPPPAAQPAEKAGSPSAAALASAERIGKEIAARIAVDDKLKSAISVTASDKGVTISITDQLDFGMFEIGSAVPRRELVLAMEKIGQILAEQKGNVAIDGHTDARPFRSGAYDNWRLSSARAQSAYYMLVRGGLDEKRITEVTGHADRDLKLPDDPLAAQNRRIEILLKVEG